MFCDVCRCPVEQGRAALGLRICLTCGDASARREAQDKQGRILPLYNKSGYTYIDPSNLRKVLLDVGRKESANPSDFIPSAVPRVVKHHITKRYIGLMWVDGDCMAVYDKSDPRLKTASRSVFFE